MNAGPHTSREPHDAWLDRIEQQLAEQDESLEQELKLLTGIGPVSLGIPGETLEELREACTPRSRPEIAPVFATRC